MKLESSFQKHSEAVCESERLKATSLKLSNVIEELNTQIKQLQAEKSNMIESSKHTQTLLKLARDNSDSLVLKVTSLEQKNNEMVNDHDLLVKELKTEINSLSIDLAEVGETVREQENSLDIKTRLVQDLESFLVQAANKFRDFESTMKIAVLDMESKYSSIIESCCSRINDVTLSVESISSKMSNLEASSALKSTTIFELEKNLEDSYCNVKQLDLKCNQQADSLSEFIQSNSTLVEKLEDTNSRIFELESQLSMEMQYKMSALDNNAQFELQISSLNNQVGEITSRLNEKTGDFHALEFDFEKAKQDHLRALKEKEFEIDGIKERNNMLLNETADSLNNEIASLNARLDEASRKFEFEQVVCDKLRDDLDVLSESNRLEVESLIEAHNTSIANLEGKLAEAREEMNVFETNLKFEKSELVNRINELEVMDSTSRSTISTINSKINQLDTTLDATNDSLDKCQVELSDCKNLIQKLEMTVSEMTLKSDNLESSLVEATNLYNEISLKLSSTEESLSALTNTHENFVNESQREYSSLTNEYEQLKSQSQEDLEHYNEQMAVSQEAGKQVIEGLTIRYDNQVSILKTEIEDVKSKLEISLTDLREKNVLIERITREHDEACVSFSEQSIELQKRVESLTVEIDGHIQKFKALECSNAEIYDDLLKATSELEDCLNRASELQTLCQSFEGKLNESENEVTRMNSLLLFERECNDQKEAAFFEASRKADTELEQVKSNYDQDMKNFRLEVDTLYSQLKEQADRALASENLAQDYKEKISMLESERDEISSRLTERIQTIENHFLIETRNFNEKLETTMQQLSEANKNIQMYQVRSEKSIEDCNKLQSMVKLLELKNASNVSAKDSQIRSLEDQLAQQAEINSSHREEAENIQYIKHEKSQLLYDYEQMQRDKEELGRKVVDLQHQLNMDKKSWKSKLEVKSVEISNLNAEREKYIFLT